MSADQDSQQRDESHPEESTATSENPGRTKTQNDNDKKTGDNDKNSKLAPGKNLGPDCVLEAFKCTDFFVAVLILFATAAAINAIANGDVLFALISGAVLTFVIAARVAFCFFRYWQVISGIALGIMAAFFLYAGFYAFSLPPGESWSGWPHVISSSILAAAALSIVLFKPSGKDKA